MQLKVNNWGSYLKTEQFNERFTVYYSNDYPSPDNFAEDVKTGLLSTPKKIQPKYFYNMEGSKLFEKICSTQEYYVTRTETSILSNFADEIIQSLDGIESICELGSGAAIKTRYLIDSFIKQKGTLQYLPIDVSNILIESSTGLLNSIPKIKINGVLSEYQRGLDIVNALYYEPKLIIFLGSSIGNFSMPEAMDFLRDITHNMSCDDRLLIGFDKVKDIDVLYNAYNDKARYTAQFNLNLLKRINDELGGNFDLHDFQHWAFFNELNSRIEMHLVSKSHQLIHIEDIDQTITFTKGESIHTENSYKFTDRMIENLANYAGLDILEKWTDERKYFSLVMFKKADIIN